MSVIVGVHASGRTVLAANGDTYFGHERAGAPDYQESKIIQVGPGLIGVSGWGVYGGLLERLAADDERPEPMDRDSIFDFFQWAWRAMSDRYHFVNNQADGESGPFTDLDSVFLVAAPGGLFHVTPILSVLPMQRFWAIGSGGEYALGALDVLWREDADPAELAGRAVEAARRFDTKSSGPIDVWPVGGTRSRGPAA